MVLWIKNQLDDFGLRVKDIVESELEALGRSADEFLSIVQDGSHPSPTILLRTPHGHDGFSVEYEHLAWKTSDKELRALIRGRLIRAYTP